MLSFLANANIVRAYDTVHVDGVWITVTKILPTYLHPHTRDRVRWETNVGPVSVPATREVRILPWEEA